MNMLDDALDALGKVEENMTTYDTILVCATPRVCSLWA